MFRFVARKTIVAGAKPSPNVAAMAQSAKRADSSTSESNRGGMGLGIVHQQRIPADESENLFRRVASPKTVSVIGAPMTYGQPFVGTVRTKLILI
mmetsp:Transcript_17698/g.32148  ORF Transcript_17698/g.32148 Transcript_17698/m.32148 type:complete len:95 (-) Transcript_17698:1155-1439(-)